MVLENGALRERVFPYLLMFITFMLLVVILLLYIAIRISIKKI